jgi:hypothetical protein
MKISYVTVPMIVLSAAALFLHLHSRRDTGGPAMHVQNEFEFTVRAPYEKVAPLFGAHGERAWGGEDWDPQFLHPQPAQDIEGEVFTVPHGHRRSVWVNTAFDLASGRVQYVYVVPDVQAVLINIQLGHDDPTRTDVKVVYQRTALAAEFNDHVHNMGQKDGQSAEEWRGAIEKYLRVAR